MRRVFNQQTDSILSKTALSMTELHRSSAKRGDKVFFLSEKIKANSLNFQPSYDPKPFTPLVVVGPSGAGKGTLIESLTSSKKLAPHFGFSVSVTTRDRRDNEIDGVHYNFVSHAQFDQMISEDQFVEYCKVHTNMYGTAKS